MFRCKKVSIPKYWWNVMVRTTMVWEDHLGVSQVNMPVLFDFWVELLLLCHRLRFLQWSTNICIACRGTEVFLQDKMLTIFVGSWEVWGCLVVLTCFFRAFLSYEEISHQNSQDAANVWRKCAFICKVFVFHKVASFSIMDLLAQLVLLGMFL